MAVTTTLGLDVGSTTVKLVAVNADGHIQWFRVQRHRGHAHKLAAQMLKQARAQYADAPLGCTGSMGVPMAEDLHARPVHEVHAVVLATRVLRPTTRTVVELGGQDAKIVFVGATPGEDDAQMNDRCAAGTGATLDRIARRLGLDEQDIRQAGSAGHLHVAAKCGVFAETDVVNLVKQGVSRQEAWGALAHAIVIQNLAVLTRGRLVRAPVLLLGGPHVHVPALAQAWEQRLGDLWLQRGEPAGAIEVPPDGELYAAVGAAMSARTHAQRPATVRGMLGGARTLEPLLNASSDHAAVERLRCSPPVHHWVKGPQRLHLGIDAGSTTIKVVLLDDAGQMKASHYSPSCGNPLGDAMAGLRGLMAQAETSGAHVEIVSVGVTGYGAALVGAALGADVNVVETVAHGLAAHHHAPDTQVVVDVGGTDVKVLRMEGGRVADFHVSNQCAAGHGAFLASAAADLGVAVEEFAPRALAASRAPRLAVGCAVFMDTDRITFQRAGFDTNELLAGLAWSVPRSIWEFVVPVPPSRLGSTFLLTGGVARNLAAAWAHARYLQQHVPHATVRVHPHPEYCGAVGAALAARAATQNAPTRFCGLEVAATLQMDVAVGEHTRCTRCENACSRSFLTLRRPHGRSQELVVGNACERGATPRSRARRTRAHAPDLMEQEASRLFRQLLPSPVPPMGRGAPLIGVPRVMGLYRCAPLLLHYLRGAGVPNQNIILSPPTSAAVFQGGARWNAVDPCFPAKLVTAHVDWLLSRPDGQKIDVLFMPAISHAVVDPHGVTDTASCPVVAASAHTAVAALNRHAPLLVRSQPAPGSNQTMVLTPDLCLVDPPRLSQQLFDAWGPILGLERRGHDAAMAHARAAQREFHTRSLRHGQRALDAAAGRGRAAAVILARPYHADPGVQHGISSELAARGVTVLTTASLPRADRSLLDLSTVMPLCTNSGDAEKIWAARVIAAHPHLVAVDLSSFRCGQDAGITGELSNILDGSGKPVLRLHDMDEDRPSASFRVRIETFVAAVRQYETGLRVRAAEVAL